MALVLLHKVCQLPDQYCGGATLNRDDVLATSIISSNDMSNSECYLLRLYITSVIFWMQSDEVYDLLLSTVLCFF